MGLRILDAHLSNLSCVQAACERISRTPIPLLTRCLRTIRLFILLHPAFALVPALAITPFSLPCWWLTPS